MTTKHPAWFRPNRIPRSKSAKAVRCLGLTLTCLVALLLFTGTAAAAFPDVPVIHPYGTAIEDLAAAGVMSGFTDGTLGPDKPIIRQQFAKMIVKTLDLPVTGNEVCPFVDVSSSAGTDPLYPAKYVAVCAQNDITQGKTDATHFDPYDNISRQQVITMVVRAADHLAPGTLEAAPAGWTGDLSYSDATHGANIKKAEYNGLLDGIWASASSPGLAGWDTSQNATRGEAAQILWSLSEGMGPPWPVAWVTYTADAFPAPGVHHYQSVSVRRYEDGSYGGCVKLQVIQNPDLPPMIATAGKGDFTELDPSIYPAPPWGLDDPHGFMFVAVFDALVWLSGPDGSPTPNPPGFPFPETLACYYYDGGGEYSEVDWLWIPGLVQDPVTGGPVSPPLGNVKVHVTGGQTGNWATWAGKTEEVFELPNPEPPPDFFEAPWEADFYVNVFQWGEKTTGSEYMNWLLALPAPITPPLGSNLTKEIVYADFDDSSGVPVATVIFRFDTKDWEPSNTYPPSVYHTFVLTDNPDPTLDHVAAYAQPTEPVPEGPYGYQFIDQYGSGVHVFMN